MIQPAVDAGIGQADRDPEGWPGQVRLAPWSERLEHVGRQFSRYLVAGGLAFALDFGVLYVLTEWAGIYYLVSAALAFTSGLALNYWLSRTWVFARRAMSSAVAEFAIFAIIGVVGLGLNEIIIWFFSTRAGLHYLAAKAISSGVVLTWNFAARRIALFS